MKFCGENFFIADKKLKKTEGWKSVILCCQAIISTNFSISLLGILGSFKCQVFAEVLEGTQK